MNAPAMERFPVGEGADAREIAVNARPGNAPGLFWLGGFRSDMAGNKASAIDEYAVARGLACTRFDYSGHGQSGGRFEDGTISRWLEEARAVFDRFTSGPQIVVGSSMGGWIALLLAQVLRDSGRPSSPSGRSLSSGLSATRVGPSAPLVAGLVLIAPAVDMTRALMWDTWSKSARKTLMASGVYLRPSECSDERYAITRALIEDGDRHLFGDRLIEVGCPVHILQGMEDKDVPWRHAQRLVTQLASDDVVLTLVKDGDHRLSRAEDIDRLTRALDGILPEARLRVPVNG
jgi:pimeloyl-ACP methyl ester carboxylesterase